MKAIFCIIYVWILLSILISFTLYIKKIITMYKILKYERYSTLRNYIKQQRNKGNDYRAEIKNSYRELTYTFFNNIFKYLLVIPYLLIKYPISCLAFVFKWLDEII